ncbi:MAG TPA: Ku protein [Candidatus Thermoplasmatota archaeon]|nr:Ku protein [Candidatus Thermoplasmatota archaeon]
MPRSLWSGSLSFGLVTVPVKLVGAVQQKEIRFHQVHVADGGRIRYKRVCEVDGEEVAPEDIAKTTEDGVLVTQEELDAVEADKSDVVDILDFVKIEEVDPIYFEKPYYLLPGKGGDKAYRLLVEAMRAKERAAVARIVFRGKEKLCVVRALERALTLTMLNYGDEVVLPEELEGVPEKGKLDKREVNLAGDLIEHLASDWSPEKYSDEHRARVQDLLDAKREGGIFVPTPPAKRAATVDLAKALEASLAAAKGKKASG